MGINGFTYKRGHLERLSYLKDDCLKINCTVSVLVSPIDSSMLNTIHVLESDIGANFVMLLEDEELSDITFSFVWERFHADKLVLAAQSTVFETRFFDGMEKNDREIIVVTDMEPKVFKVAYVLIINSAGFNVAYHIIW